jgi:4-amino-4-deoxy-L-arabinose transferase-like glycosyltransferase
MRFLLAPAPRLLRIVAVSGFLAATLVPRLTGVGSIVTIDEPLWEARGARFLEGLAVGDFPKTFTHVHPGVTTAWLVGLARPWGTLAAAQAAVAIAVSIGLVCITYVLARLTSFWVGLAAGTTLALDPFYIAHSRVVHTDALLATFLLLTAVLLLFFRSTRLRRYLVFAGVSGGLAALTKLQGLVLFPLVVVALHRRGQSWRVTAEDVAVWGIAAGLAVVLLWPALWVPTLANVRFFIERMTIELREIGVRGGEEYWWF